MAKLGMKHVVAAKLTETDGVGSYSDGKVIGEAIKSNTTITSYDVKLYADDAVSEQESGFKEGSTSLEMADLGDENAAFLLGHSLENITVDGKTAKELKSNAEDMPPYVGYGFYGKKKNKGVKLYRAVWFHKVKFGEPNDENETQGENISFKTPTITGTVLKDANGDWKSEATFDSEELAVKYLNQKAGIATA